MLTWTEYNNDMKRNSISDYIFKNRKTRQHMYQKYIQKEKEMNHPIQGMSATLVCIDDYVTTGSSTGRFSFADCNTPQPKYVVDPILNTWINKEEGINPMNYATATVQAGTTETQDQRKYLEKRLYEVYSDKREPLEAAFGLVDDDAPTGPVELAERLKDGKYTLRTGDRYTYWHWTDLIQWRDPAKKQDTDGFKTAVDELKALRQKSLDIIKIDDVKAGLDAVKALEAWEPTGAAN